MEETSFENIYDSITRLNNTDGPSKNVFEPKFQARQQMLELLKAVTASHEKDSSLRSQVQIARCHLFIGNTMIETEEVSEGFRHLYRSHFILGSCVSGNLLPLTDMNQESELSAILKMNTPLVTPTTGFGYVREYISCLNTLGLHMCSTDSEQRMNDAKKILHLSEACYTSWDRLQTANGCVKMSEVPMTEDGCVTKGVANYDQCVLRHRLDSLYTSTLFFLAQAYTQTDAIVASKYAHLTMVYQLQTRSEFSKKSWAENALHLCGFYGGQSQFGKALHCLQAGKYMMPTEPDDEETTGRVAWAFARYHLSRLRYYMPHSSLDETFVDVSDGWFVPFPLPLPPIEKQPHIRTFDDAREEFKKANANFTLALKYFAFDGQCTDHIRILQDISELYKCLIVFEPDTERKVAMHGRRLTLLEKVPEELNPQAYLTTIRQLEYDIAEIANDIFHCRLNQKKAENNSLGKPLSEKRLNILNGAARHRYASFLESFKGEKQPEEVRLAIFRSKMHICSLLTKQFFKTPKEEYDGISEATDAYADVIAFVTQNPLGPEVADEIELAKQMHSLLPGKKRAIAQAFQHAQ